MVNRNITVRRIASTSSSTSSMGGGGAGSEGGGRGGTREGIEKRDSKRESPFFFSCFINTSYWFKGGEGGVKGRGGG